MGITGVGAYREPVGQSTLTPGATVELPFKPSHQEGP